jgi:hypothetical protein
MTSTATLRYHDEERIITALLREIAQERVDEANKLFDTAIAERERAMNQTLDEFREMLRRRVDALGSTGQQLADNIARVIRSALGERIGAEQIVDDISGNVNELLTRLRIRARTVASVRDEFLDRLREDCRAVAETDTTAFAVEPIDIYSAAHFHSSRTERNRVTGITKRATVQHFEDALSNAGGDIFELIQGILDGIDTADRASILRELRGRCEAMSEAVRSAADEAVARKIEAIRAEVDELLPGLIAVVESSGLRSYQGASTLNGLARLLEEVLGTQLAIEATEADDSIDGVVAELYQLCERGEASLSSSDLAKLREIAVIAGIDEGVLDFVATGELCSIVKSALSGH